MTQLDKPVTRLAKQTYKGAQIVVTLAPEGCLQVKRLRHKETFKVPFEAAFESDHSSAVLDKPVTVLAKQNYRGVPIVLTLEPHGVIAVRRKNHKERFTVPFESLFEIGARIAILGERNSDPDAKLQKRKRSKL